MHVVVDNEVGFTTVADVFTAAACTAPTSPG